MSETQENQSGSTQIEVVENGRSKLDALEPFRDRILAWRAEGRDLRAIASHVRAAGCCVPVDHNVISRFLKRHGISTARPKAEITPLSESGDTGVSREEASLTPQSLHLASLPLTWTSTAAEEFRECSGR